MPVRETIFALSSGQPPAAIAVIRISGKSAANAITALAGTLPESRVGTLRKITNPVNFELLDNALCLWFPGPNSATGEDLAEIHCHGGRAVVRAISDALDQMEGLRPAEPGEFTRRAFTNGRMDLAEAEGLSDLLFAETEWQRKAAIQSAGGAFSKQIDDWQSELMRISAQVEAELDFSDEEDVGSSKLESIVKAVELLAQTLESVLMQPRAEKLREGVRVVLGGPPNSGKSTLLNALVDRDAAIVSDIAGTTRDVIEVPISLGGIPFLFVDTAGVRDDGAEAIEKIGIDRAREQFGQADMILWLGQEGEGPDHEALVEVASRSDAQDHTAKSPEALSISPVTGRGMDDLVTLLQSMAADILPKVDQTVVNDRQAVLLGAAKEYLYQVAVQTDLLIVAEHLRLARQSLDSITGKASTEDMLDSLFGKFCIGK